MELLAKIVLACVVAPVVLFAAAASVVWLFDRLHRLVKRGGAPNPSLGSSSQGRPYNQDEDWPEDWLEWVHRLPEVRS